MQMVSLFKCTETTIVLLSLLCIINVVSDTNMPAPSYNYLKHMKSILLFKLSLLVLTNKMADKSRDV